MQPATSAAKHNKTQKKKKRKIKNGDQHTKKDV